MVDNFLIARDRLAAFLPDNDTIRRFEKLFNEANVTTPANIDFIFKIIQELSIDIVNADSKGVLASNSVAALARDVELLTSAPAPDLSRIDALSQLMQAVSEYIGTADANANRLNSLLTALSRDLEVSATSPRFQMPNSFPIDYIDFNQAAPTDVSQQVGRLAWNAGDDTLDIQHSGGVTQQVGQELFGRIVNNTGSTIPNGSCLGINPATNSFVLFTANGTLSPITIVGVSTQDIPNGAAGRITVWGRVHDLNTSGTPFGEVWTAGQILYVSPTIAGGFTSVKPTAPNLSMPIAQVITVNATTGIIAVRPTIEQQLFYGSFVKTSDQVPAAANTAYAITWDSALIANGVAIGAPTSRIICTNAGLYNFSASFQLTSSSASVKNVWFWFRKNGVDVANTSLITSLDSGTAIRAPSRSLFFSMAAGDYIELMLASDSTNITLDNIAATAFAPAAPAAILTVTQEQQ